MRSGLGARSVIGGRDVGAVLLTWALLVTAEFVVIGVTCRGLFAGNWELVLGRRVVGPVALAMLVPAAFALVSCGHLAARAEAVPRARALLGVAVGAALGALAFGLSRGRHFESLAVRAAFVATLSTLGVALTYALGGRIVHVFRGRHRRSLAAGLGLAGTGLFWLVDARVMPRLYPAFHLFAFALTLLCSGLTVLSWLSRPSSHSRSPADEATTRIPRSELALSAVGVAMGAAACVFAPFAARQLVRSDNLRFVLEEHAPILGRAVRLAAWLAPPLPLDVEDARAPGAGAPVLGEVPRALDWGDEDILLVSVDALRADHLGAYGYARGTTPNLDALARSGALFEHAYCPTPHTSYSVTSMMTGKAMRPLLSLGLGKESDTWATYLRRYGYKTAAFYPPAVFYIDHERFADFDASGLGFEYKWVEFTTAEEKAHEVERYLARAGPEPVFLWVHIFEPHEPYLMHAGYGYGGDSPGASDAYDSEVAYADAAIGELVRAVRARRPKVAIVVTADHGEEFGEHGGRYHGTTCYEEQVRVPLIVSGPGVVPRHVSTVVQTIDLLPTVLSALGIPRPARVRGRDLGAVLARASDPVMDPGLAYAETDDQTLIARGDDRLLCARSVAACALYDVAKDPEERHDRGATEPGLLRELRGLTAGVERDQGRYEVASVVWPDALRRGLQGEADAAGDVAGLLDDASVDIRRQAAAVTFRLAATAVLPEARRALARDEDDEVRRWTALALVRMGDPPNALADSLLHDPSVTWRRSASLAFALAGDPRGKVELASFWRDAGPPKPGLATADARELLGALARVRDEAAVPSLVASLGYVPLRPRLAETLGDIGDVRARAPLLGLFETERYETARPFEARALVKLGADRDLLAPLTMFAGLVEPMPEAFPVAREAKLLDPNHGGLALATPAVDVDASVLVRADDGARRIWIMTAAPSETGGGGPSGDVDAEALAVVATSGGGYQADLAGRHHDGVGPAPREGAHDPALRAVRVRLHDPRGIVAFWVVPRTTETPPSLRAPLPDAGTMQPP